MNTRIIIVGAGGHGRVVADALLAGNRPVAGFIDPDKRMWGTHILGLPVLGGDEVLDSLPASATELANGIGSAGVMDARQRVYQSCVDRGFGFVSVVHPLATIATSARLGKGVQVFARAVIQPLADVGENTIINTGAIVEHDVTVGAHCHISPGCVLAGEVRIGDRVHVGVGAIVIQRIVVGARSFVAAGAVVVADVEEGSRVMGVPARVQD